MMALEGKGTNEWVSVTEWEPGAGIQHQRGGAVDLVKPPQPKGDAWLGWRYPQP